MAYFQDSQNAPQWVNRSLGFRKMYSFVLWLLTCGILLGFSISRLKHLDESRREKGLSPGEQYWLQTGRYRIGITMHLACILLAGILVPLQFIPQIRYKAILFHRVNGYIVIILIFVATAGALIISRRSFGGSMAIQAIVVCTSFATLAALTLAYVSIRRLQIDQHRKWMIRAMVWMSFIITARPFVILIAMAVTADGGYGNVWQCGEVEWVYTRGSGRKDTGEADFLSAYPSCVGAPPETLVAVKAAFRQSRVGSGAALREGFPAGMIVAWFIHVFGTECYLKLTKDETKRLRQFSLQRQLKRGFKSSGSAKPSSDRGGVSDSVPHSLKSGQVKRTNRGQDKVLDDTR
ncbi:hypothetical protein DL96DRAFT_1623579 [Flagelloscypha sp. PMI_526]|nr:hypothetical protein DL96DRAFT_1623579 [Flagelloscypha sp. PMI_526]